MSYLPHAHRHAAVLAAWEEVPAILRGYAERYHIPGMAYGLVVEGELIAHGAHGYADVESGLPATVDTVFRIASMTKSFTALAVAQLRDAGRLSLDDPIARYIPELADLSYPTADSPPITVRDLMTMSAGWPQDDPWGDRQLARTDAEFSAMLRGGVSFAAAPGVAFEYSNLGYMVLGRLIHNVSGLGAPEYIARNVLQPLDMQNTVWNAKDVAVCRLAAGYRWRDERWVRENLLPCGGDVAAFGGLFSTVRDLARWVALFQAAWPPRDEAESGPLKRSSLREMQKVWRARPSSFSMSDLGGRPNLLASGYGEGLFVPDNGQYSAVGHSGGLPGFGSHMRWLPDHGIGMIGLANLTYAPMHEAVAEALDHVVRQARWQPRPAQPAPALHQAQQDVTDLLNGWDDGVADRLFAENFFLDEARECWQARLAALHAVHGALHSDGPIAAENALRGRWRLSGERGWCVVWISLAPTAPPRIQEMRIRSAPPPNPALLAAVEQLAQLSRRPSRRRLDGLMAAGVDAAAIFDQVRMVQILCGACRVGDVLASDGETSATFRLEGPRGQTDVDIMIEAATGRLVRVHFRPAA